MRTVHVITTGGTIEKIYSETKGSVENLDNKVDRYLNRLRLPDTHVDIVHLMNKDSLEMSDADRQFICAAVQAKLSTRSPIVITHGTDTMVETGLYLKREIANPEVPIVLTGSMTHSATNRAFDLLAFGGQSGRVYIIACEPELLESREEQTGLSPALRDAVPQAVELIEKIIRQLLGAAAEVKPLALASSTQFIES